MYVHAMKINIITNAIADSGKMAGRNVTTRTSSKSTLTTLTSATPLYVRIYYAGILFSPNPEPLTYFRAGNTLSVCAGLCSTTIRFIRTLMCAR